MNCPSCGNLLQSLSVETNSAGRFEVEHCGKCGGTWFDPYEINRIPYHEVVRIAKLTVLPQNPPQELKVHLCPRCRKEMSSFDGEAVPRGVKLSWCRKCLGIFATQKDLWEFKKYQEETIEQYQTKDRFFPALSVVFVPAVTFLFLFITTFITITSLQDAKEERIIASSEIRNIEISKYFERAAVLSFETSQALRSEITWGKSSLEMITLPVSAEPSYIHNIILKDLARGENYIYKITLIDEDGRRVTGEKMGFGME